VKSIVNHFTPKGGNMNNSIIAEKMKRQIDIFSGKLSKGVPKSGRRLIKEALYGIQVRQSVRLTEICRALQEPISLKKTEDRLCYQINRKGLGKKVTQNMIQEGSIRVEDDTLLIIDLSDISKKYAKKMEYMTGVHDGSDHKIGDGYWLMQVVGAEIDEIKITPLYGKLYSQDAPDYESENKEILAGVDSVTAATERRGIWVMDRGGDRLNLLEPLLNREQRFIIRQVGQRHVLYRGKLLSTKSIAARCKMRYAERVVKEEGDKEKIYNIEYGYQKLQLPGNTKQLYMVVIQGFGAEPMMLLTNVALQKSRKSLFKIVVSYIRRWQIEDSIRFMKQSYNLEDIRLLTYQRLQNMLVLVMGAMYFACVWLGDRLKLNILVHHALQSAKRLFGIPDFRYYAIADGIKEIFAGYRGKFSKKILPNPLFTQVLMFDP